MKTLLKISAMTLYVSIFAYGCSGCGNQNKPAPEKIDTLRTGADTTKAAPDVTKTKVDTARKDTSKKK